MVQSPLSANYTQAVFQKGEIVMRNWLLSQAFDDGDSVVADKGFQIQDILPLGVTLKGAWS